MSGTEAEAAMVCGFWDEKARIAGMGWKLAGAAGGLFARGGDVEAGGAEIEQQPGGAVRLRLDAGDCEALLTPRGAELGPNGSDPAARGPSFALCDAEVTAGGARPVRCAGHVSRWREQPTDGTALLRHLAIPAPDGGVVVLAAHRGPGPEDHASEVTSAWLVDREGRSSAFPEALLSTQYDGRGQQVRAGLELWPEDEDAPAMRAAATLVGAAAREGGVSAALMSSSAEGTHGLGSYLIWRAQ
jgi:hypothetical protein